MSSFFDTNILVYAFLDLEKRTVALDNLSNGGTTSAQILNEFTHVARNKRQRPCSEIENAVVVIHLQFPDIRP